MLGDPDGGPPVASEVAEIRVHTASGFYDFEAKYLAEEQVDLDVPADVDAELADEVQHLAVRTFEAIGCEGLARVDVFVTRTAGRGQRDQHDAGLHRPLDVPADVGRQRAWTIPRCSTG